jgi:hypothetical protein
MNNRVAAIVRRVVVGYAAVESFNSNRGGDFDRRRLPNLIGLGDGLLNLGATSYSNRGCLWIGVKTWYI